MQPVGLTADGSLAVLGSTSDVGWYKLGAYPGRQGSAVMDGHVDTSNGSAGVFYSLGKLKAGDKLSVVDPSGTTIFVVLEKKYYPYTAQPAEVFNKNDKAYLNLITCTGTWDKSRKGFDERLVVFTAATKTERNG